jgi:hypothetical protein
MLLVVIIIAYCVIGALGSAVMYSACVRASLADDGDFCSRTASSRNQRIAAHTSS